MKPDLDGYTLALLHEGHVVYSSREGGLQPLIDCLAACRGRYRNGLLHDRVVGLAAARLMAPTGVVQTVVTGTVSQPALTFLEAHQIVVRPVAVVDQILTADRRLPCPAEIIALEVEDLLTFQKRLAELLQGMKV